MVVKILVISAICLILWFWFRILNRRYFVLALSKRVRTVDGSDVTTKVYQCIGRTPFGNNFDWVGNSPAQLFDYTRNAAKLAKGRPFLLYYMKAPMYNVQCAEDAQEIFQSTQLITKNVFYDLLVPFMNEGLLTSTDQKWRSRRKMLTPTFHFNLLHSFLEVFKIMPTSSVGNFNVQSNILFENFREESNKIVKLLNTKVGGEIIVNQIIPQYTLNNICETAMGVKLDDMEDGQRYRDAIHAIELIIVKRASNPFMYFWIYFYFMGEYRKNVENLKIAHDFSSRIIQRKREQFQRQRKQQTTTTTEGDAYGIKQRYAMLDTLLAAEEEGLIDHKGICEEVDSLIFAGYDTTSTCLIFTILMLSLHQDVQEKCYKEVQQSIDNPTVFDYNQLMYLECVIKESLRLYPTVPFIGRKSTKECEVNGLILPAETLINIHLYEIMRDPRHFPNPTEFQPERFLPENTTNRHPFAFVPFSAGHRNCLGQKFAILEIKVLLVALLKNFQVLPRMRVEDIVFEAGIVLRSQQNIKVHLERRN